MGNLSEHLTSGKKNEQNAKNENYLKNDGNLIKCDVAN